MSYDLSRAKVEVRIRSGKRELRESDAVAFDRRLRLNAVGSESLECAIWEH